MLVHECMTGAQFLLVRMRVGFSLLTCRFNAILIVYSCLMHFQDC